jgi:hypothetical protein
MDRFYRTVAVAKTEPGFENVTAREIVVSLGEKVRGEK